MSEQSPATTDLRWVVCPVCHQQLHLQAGAIQCQSCGRCYPVADGIPVLLADRASWPLPFETYPLASA